MDGRGKEGWEEGREGGNVLVFNIIEFINIFLHGLDFFYLRNFSLFQLYKDIIIYIILEVL